MDIHRSQRNCWFSRCIGFEHWNNSKKIDSTIANRGCQRWPGRLCWIVTFIEHSHQCAKRNGTNRSTPNWRKGKNRNHWNWRQIDQNATTNSIASRFVFKWIISLFRTLKLCNKLSLRQILTNKKSQKPALSTENNIEFFVRSYRCTREWSIDRYDVHGFQQRRRMVDSTFGNGWRKHFQCSWPLATTKIECITRALINWSCRNLWTNLCWLFFLFHFFPFFHI